MTSYPSRNQTRPPARRKRRTKQGCLFRLLLFLLAILLLCVGGIFFVKHQIEQAWLPVNSTQTAEQAVEIQPGSGVRGIADQLEREGLIQNQDAFVLYCRIYELEQLLKAGIYHLSPSQSVPEIASILASGQVHRNLITIPEGFTVAQIGQRVIEGGFFTQEEWDAAIAEDYQRAYLTAGSGVREPLEGFLFPDTYSVSEDLAAETFIQMMLNRFEEIWQQTGEDAGTDLSLWEIVTIASLIERECQLESEQATISGVIYNRLNRGMPLQLDASVLYALDEHKDTVLYRDLEVDSPYNTYLYPGLPPGPIACPGQKALHAALHPEEHQYLYYVATGDGGHEFSTNYNDHLKAQQKYQP